MTDQKSPSWKNILSMLQFGVKIHSLAPGPWLPGPWSLAPWPLVPGPWPQFRQTKKIIILLSILLSKVIWPWIYGCTQLTLVVKLRIFFLCRSFDLSFADGPICPSPSRRTWLDKYCWKIAGKHHCRRVITVERLALQEVRAHCRVTEESLQSRITVEQSHCRVTEDVMMMMMS